jgi:osmoprotectant transport system permease protein
MINAALVARIAALVLLLGLILRPELFKPVLEPLTENGAPAIYNEGSLLDLTVDHLALVAGSSLIAAILAILMGVFVTRESGAEFLPLSRTIVNIGQTFPPVAVLALAVPAVGFGVKPTMIALVLYGLLPIFENTITGLGILAHFS